MNTIDDLLDAMSSSARGRIYLINLLRTLRVGYVAADHVKAACEECVARLAMPPRSIPDADGLVDHLGSAFVGRGLWMEAPEPLLDPYVRGSSRCLTRLTSYGGFFFSILGRGRGTPPLPGLPEPLNAVGGADEIEAADVESVRRTIDSDAWRGFVSADEVRLHARCLWMAPLSRLNRNVARRGSSSLADSHRDVIGLSHFHEGHHLIRLDFDLLGWPSHAAEPRRRPHGAGNGGKRFRLLCDGKPAACNWGRTVDLARVAALDRRNLNGVPELLVQGCSVPKSAIRATYLGRLSTNPEDKDAFFEKRLLRRGEKMDAMIDELKRELA